MMQHIAIYKILDNFHSFFCKGDKSYKEASANIKVFNLTKVLGNHGSIPDSSGHQK